MGGHRGCVETRWKQSVPPQSPSVPAVWLRSDVSSLCVKSDFGYSGNTKKNKKKEPTRTLLITVKLTGLKTKGMFQHLEVFVSNMHRWSFWRRFQFHMQTCCRQKPGILRLVSLVRGHFVRWRNSRPLSCPERAAVLAPLSSHLLLSAYIFSISFPAGPSPQSRASPTGFGAIWNYNPGAIHPAQTPPYGDRPFIWQCTRYTIRPIVGALLA